VDKPEKIDHLEVLRVEGIIKIQKWDCVSHFLHNLHLCVSFPCRYFNITFSQIRWSLIGLPCIFVNTVYYLIFAMYILYASVIEYIWN
jgi:hypothetical protein